MSQGNRPGGLTALAVINFVIGGIACLGLIALLALLGAADQLSEGEASVAVASDGGVMLSLIMGVLTVVLLIISGIGYLGQKKMMGHKLGNAYAVISILSSIIGIIAASQSFGIGSIIGFIYPCVTLFLLNTTFKQDFVN